MQKSDVDVFTAADREALAVHGIALSEAARQLELFHHPPPPIRLHRACVVGDGILRIQDAEHDDLLTRWQDLAETGRLMKFVPASGAASRMFRDLKLSLKGAAGLTHAELEREADEGHAAAETLRRFLDGLGRFAFLDHLRESFESDSGGATLEETLERGDFGDVVRHLLEPEGLGYDNLPKGLIDFHRYDDVSRTAFEEHLMEAAGHLGGEGGVCRVHFTVSPDHEEAFREVLETVRPKVEEHCRRRLEVSFSTQTSDTDTLSVTPENLPFRDADGSLVFRPAGHGALLANLEATAGDIVFVKNVDNITPERNHLLTILWKRLLAGLFGRIEEELRALAERLDAAAVDEATVREAEEILTRTVAWRPPDGGTSAEERRTRLQDRLDRPLRVCGVVRNEGEPGGGPFWVRSEDGELSGQIVEAAQVDLSDSEQASLWDSSTHFNPVDLVCGLKDRHGRPHDLSLFLDPGTSFVAAKSHDGRPLKSLERPGLWNGAMARWNTVFVEVPLATFSPVKTLFDLLKPEHQP